MGELINDLPQYNNSFYFSFSLGLHIHMEHRGIMNNLISGLEFVGFIVFAIVLIEIIIPAMCYTWNSYINDDKNK